MRLPSGRYYHPSVHKHVLRSLRVNTRHMARITSLRQSLVSTVAGEPFSNEYSIIQSKVWATKLSFVSDIDILCRYVLRTSVGIVHTPTNSPLVVEFVTAQSRIEFYNALGIDS